MLQVVDDHSVYVVKLDKMPRLPVVGEGIDQYYAEGLTLAIASGIVRPPGMFAIEIDFATMQWMAYEVVEPERYTPTVITPD